MDRTAALLGGAVVGAVCTAVVLLELSTAAALLGGIGAVLAGAVSDPERFDGAVEGAVAAGVGVPVTLLAVALARFVAFQGTESPLQLLWLTGGPQAIAAVFVVVPLALAVGALAGWLGKLARDFAGGGVSLAGS